MRKPARYWNLKHTVAECKNVVEEYGRLLSKKELCEMKISGLANAIGRNGGMIKIRGMLGIELKRKPNGHWNLENTVDECKKVAKKYGKLPGYNKLYEMKMSGLATAITNNGGMIKIRGMLGMESEGKKKNGYWNLENTLNECKKVIKEYGELPSKKELCEMKISGLANAITKNGGYSKIGRMLGIELKRMPNSYWNLENTLAECKKMIEDYGELNSDKLIKMKMFGLSSAITKNGGYIKIREMLGINKSNPLKDAVMEYLK
jgi:hypothetical protein